MSKEKLNVNVKIDTQFCLRILNQMEERPYRDKRTKKGFIMRKIDPQTGQFTQGRGISYWRKKRNN